MKLLTNKKIQLTIAVCIIAVVNLYDLFSQYAITIVDDEFGYVAMGAQMAGYDWTSTLSTANYYSYGFGMILSVLFRIGLTGTAFYRAVIVLNTLFLIVAFLITNYLAEKLVSERWNTFIALAINLYTSNLFQCQLNWSETVLYLLTWVLILFIYQANQNYELKYLIPMAVIAIYMYTVHQRCLSVIIASVMMMTVILLNGHLNKKNVGKFIIVLLVFVGLFALTSEIKEYIIGNWYVASSANDTRIAVNDYGAQTRKIKKLADIKNLACLFLGLIGKLWAQVVASGMLILYPIIIFVRLVFQKTVALLKKEEKTSLDEKEVFLLTAVLLFLGSLGIASIYKLRTLSEQRYYEIVMTRYIDYVAGPMLLCGFSVVIRAKDYLKEIVVSLVATVIMTVLTYYQFVKSYSPIMISVNMASIYPFIKNVTENLSIILMVGVSVIFFVLCMIAILHFSSKYQKENWGIAGIILVMACIFGYNGITEASYFTGYKQEEVVEYVLPVVEYIEENEWNGTIYYLAGGKVDKAYNFLKILQFMLPEQKIEFVKAEEIDTLFAERPGDIFMVATKELGEFKLDDIQDKFVMDTGRLCVYTVGN